MARSRSAVVAMSGGVDSSVTAALLAEEGYDVTGIMLKLWKGETANTNSGCCNVGAANDAARVADALGIRFYVLNFADRFNDSVVRNFHEDYAAGRTPNPCVRCNQWIKFDALLEVARALDADVLATGHYARVRVVDGRYRLLRGVDAQKDQSYVLWMLGQEELAHVRLPVGEMEKSETRRIAGELGLRTAAKPDSQEICFVRDGDVRSYVADNIPQASRPGPIFDTKGRTIGEHRGIAAYTVGQRKGVGVALGEPVFVTRIDARSNAIVVGDRRDLAVSRLTTEEARFVDEVLPPASPVLVQHRAHGDVRSARLYPRMAGRVDVAFDAPVEAVAPGQSAAFYDVDEPQRVLGGGVIASTVAASAVA